MLKFVPKKTHIVKILIVILSIFLLFELNITDTFTHHIFKKLSIVETHEPTAISRPNISDSKDQIRTDDVPLIDRLALPDCPSKFEQLFNTTNYTNVILKEELEFDKIEANLANEGYSIRLGGQWAPSECETKYKIAIIIPYRDRLTNLKVFLNNMHPFFMRQKMNYGIYLVEPSKNLTFNRGILMNIGFLEALKDTYYLWDCFFFHDVDMIPEDIRNIYTCDDKLPKHYAVAVSKWNYKTTGYFKVYYGGINAFTREQFKSINGFSNNFFGWGGEDDDLRKRTEAVFKSYIKQPEKINRYFMGSHQKQQVNPKRGQILGENGAGYKKGQLKEGISNIQYKVLKIEKLPLYTHIFVNHPNSKFT